MCFSGKALLNNGANKLIWHRRVLDYAIELLRDLSKERKDMAPSGGHNVVLGFTKCYGNI